MFIGKNNKQQWALSLLKSHTENLLFFYVIPLYVIEEETLNFHLSFKSGYTSLETDSQLLKVKIF